MGAAGHRGRIPHRLLNETQHHSISHQSTILSHNKSIRIIYRASIDGFCDGGDIEEEGGK